MDDRNGMMKTLARGELSLTKVGNNGAPFKGVAFESKEVARAFYDYYARQIGFLTCVLSSWRFKHDRLVISHVVGCRGLVDNQTKVQI